MNKVATISIYEKTLIKVIANYDYAVPFNHFVCQERRKGSQAELEQKQCNNKM